LHLPAHDAAERRAACCRVRTHMAGVLALVPNDVAASAAAAAVLRTHYDVAGVQQLPSAVMRRGAAGALEPVFSAQELVRAVRQAAGEPAPTSAVMRAVGRVCDEQLAALGQAARLPFQSQDRPWAVTLLGAQQLVLKLTVCGDAARSRAAAALAQHAAGRPAPAGAEALDVAMPLPAAAARADAAALARGALTKIVSRAPLRSHAAPADRACADTAVRHAPGVRFAVRLPCSLSAALRAMRLVARLSSASVQSLHAKTPRLRDQLEAAEAPARDPFAALPHALALALFALLPVDQRLRCAEVCRGWRALLSDASLWLLLDLSAASGVTRASDALLRTAAARAAGGVQALDLTGCSDISVDAVRVVAAKNSSALVELRMSAHEDMRNVHGQQWPLTLSTQQFEQLLQAPPQLRVLEWDATWADSGAAAAAAAAVPPAAGAAPQLRVLESDATCAGADEARRLLRNEAPFGPLRVRKLVVSLLADADAVRSFIEDAAAHECLTGVKLVGAPLNVPAALDAMVDAALHLRLTYVEFDECGLTPASAPALARVLGGGALRTLSLSGNPSTLLGSLTAHPCLRKLDISYNRVRSDRLAAPVVAAAGAALAALVAANAPALHELHLRDCWLGDLVMGALADALPHNMRLRILDCRHNHVAEAFMRDRMQRARVSPAARAHCKVQFMK
jgi:hypothetical protein